MYIVLAIFIFLVLVPCYCLLRAVGYGREIHPRAYKSVKIQYHKRWVNRFIFFLIFPVGFIEMLVQMNGGRWGETRLFLVHMVFVVVFAFCLIAMRLFYTGLKNPSMHRKLFKVLLLSFFGVAITGGMLILQFPAASL